MLSLFKKNILLSRPNAYFIGVYFVLTFNEVEYIIFTAMSQPPSSLSFVKAHSLQLKRLGL
jgi:hypothetical protein